VKRTKASTLLLLVAIGAVGAGLVQAVLASVGRPIIIPPFTLPAALAAIGVIVVMMAVPISRMVRGTSSARGPVDPFYATRVVMLAKASALGGGLLTGGGIGLLVYLLSRSVAPGVGSLGLTIAALIGAGVLLAGGLIAEFMCRIPPDNDNDEDKPLRASPEA